MHLIVEPGFPLKKKKELISHITSSDGVISYMITKQVSSNDWCFVTFRNSTLIFALLPETDSKIRFVLLEQIMSDIVPKHVHDLCSAAVVTYSGNSSCKIVRRLSIKLFKVGGKHAT